uniref:DUF4817 domain-containing protein n=1 Tax=Cacopsylla melanoneura TaxID=428564 RepID=A0A8D9BNJ8_9HEMI
MAKFLSEQRLLIVKTFYQNNESIVLTLKSLRSIFIRQNCPNSTSICRLVCKFESTYLFSLSDVPVPMRQRSARNGANIAVERESIRNNPNQSIPRRSQELGLSLTSLWRILRKDLKLHHYKIKLTQELKPLD